MRLTEVESSDNQKVAFLEKYFIFRDANIDNDGGITVEGNCKITNQFVKDKIKTLPIKFNYIAGNFDIKSTELETLENCPIKIEGDFICNHTNITSLIGGPRFVVGDYTCHHTILKSLDGIAEEIAGALILTYHENLPLLKVLQIKGLTFVSFYPGDNKVIEGILDKYIGNTSRGNMLKCAAELTKAGFKGNAKL